MLSQVLRALRISQDMTIDEFSKKLGLSASYTGELERGSKKGSLKVLQKYASATGVSPAQIVFIQEISEKNNHSFQKILILVLETLLKKEENHDTNSIL